MLSVTVLLKCPGGLFAESGNIPAVKLAPPGVPWPRSRKRCGRMLVDSKSARGTVCRISTNNSERCSSTVLRGSEYPAGLRLESEWRGSSVGIEQETEAPNRQLSGSCDVGVQVTGSNPVRARTVKPTASLLLRM